MRRLSDWLGLLLLVAVGAAIWMGISLRRANLERDSLWATIGKLRVAAVERDNELIAARQASERAKTEAEAVSKQLSVAQGQWEVIVQPKHPSAPAWAPLARATGLTWEEAGRKNEMWPERVSWAIRFLSETVLLAPAELPPSAEVDYRVSFTGVPDGEVVLWHDVAYFRGNAYYRPGLTRWFGTNMHAN